MNVERFKKAIEAFDQYNSRDPHNLELLYAERMTNKLQEYFPSASEHLQLAARAQHVGRWEIPRADFPMDRYGYLKWRNALKKKHAAIAELILQDSGYESGDIEKVKSIIAKEAKNPDAQILEDVVCLVFLEYYAEQFASKHPDEKVIDILKKTIKKMSSHAIVIASGLNLSVKVKSLLHAASQN